MYDKQTKPNALEQGFRNAINEMKHPILARTPEHLQERFHSLFPLWLFSPVEDEDSIPEFSLPRNPRAKEAPADPRVIDGLTKVIRDLLDFNDSL